MGGRWRGNLRALTREAVIDIYTSPEPHTVLSLKYGVTMTHVLRIRQGAKCRTITEGLPQPQYKQSVAGIRLEPDGSLTGRSLTAEQAAEIFMSPERAVDMARKFNITQSLVSSIRKGCAWRHVTKDLTQPERPAKWKQKPVTTQPLGS